MKWCIAAIAILVLGVIVLGWRGYALSVRAEQKYPPIGQFIDIDGVQLHYTDQGAGPPIVLIHGASGNLRDFAFDLAPALAKHYRVIAFDRPGLGYSDRLDPAFNSIWTTKAESPRDQARLLEQAAAQLGVQNPIVVGHSFGGAVALAWGLEFPDTKGLVLLAPVSEPWPDNGLGFFYDITASSLGGAIVPYVIAGIATDGQVKDAIDGAFTPQTAPDTYADNIGGLLSARAKTFRADGRQVNALRPHMVEMSPQYPTLTMPVEILHGTADISVPIDIHAMKTVVSLPNATLTTLDGIGHMPHHLAQDDVIAAVGRVAALP